MAGGRTPQQRIQALLERGLTALDAGRYDEALRNWNEVLALDPRHERAQRLVGDLQALMAAERGDPPVEPPTEEPDPISGEFVVMVDEAKPSRPVPPPPPPGALARSTRPMRATEENAAIGRSQPGSGAYGAVEDNPRKAEVSEEVAAVTTSVSKSALGRLRRLVESQATEFQVVNAQLSEVRSENLHLREEINLRERAVIDLRDKLLELERKFAALDEERRAFERSRSARESSDAALEATVAELTEQAQAALERIASLEAELTSTQSRLDEETQEHAATRLLLDDANEQLSIFVESAELSHETSSEAEAKALADEAAREQLMAEMQGLRERVVELEAAQSDAEGTGAERDGLRSEVERLVSELASARELGAATAERLTAERDGLAAEVERVSAELAAMRSLALSHEAALAAMGSSSERIATLETRLAGAELVAVQARGQVTERDGRIAELERQLAELPQLLDERDRLVVELAEAEADLAEVDKVLAERDSAVAQAGELELMLTAVGNRVVVLEPLEAQVATLSLERDAIRAELDAVREQLESRLMELEGAQASASTSSTRIDELEAALETANAALDDMRTRNETSLTTMVQERDLALADAEGLRGTIQALTGRIRDLETQVGSANAGREEAVASRAMLVTEAGDLRARNSMLEATLKELTDAADLALVDISKLRNERDLLRQELASRGELLRSTTVELEGVHAEVSRLSHQVREREAQLAAASAGMHQLRSERDMTRSQLQEATDAANRALSELDALRREAQAGSQSIVRAESELQRLQAELASHQAGLAQANAELAQLRGEAASHQTQLAEADAELAELRAVAAARSEAANLAVVAQLEAARNESSELRHTLEQRERDLRMLREAVTALTEQAAVLEQARAGASSETSVLANRVAELEAALATSERQRAEALAGLSEQQKAAAAATARATRGAEVSERIHELEALVDRMALQIRATARLTNPGGEVAVTDVHTASTADSPVEPTTVAPSPTAVATALIAPPDNTDSEASSPGEAAAFAAPPASTDTPGTDTPAPSDFAKRSVFDDTPVESPSRSTSAEQPVVEFRFTGENAAVAAVPPVSPRDRLRWMIDEVPRLLSHDLKRVSDLGSRAVFVLQTIDGRVSYADILDLVNLPPDETATLLISLIDRGMIASPSTET